MTRMMMAIKKIIKKRTTGREVLVRLPALDWVASLPPLISPCRVCLYPYDKPYQATKPGKAAKGEANEHKAYK
jgi:hypothetical protein